MQNPKFEANQIDTLYSAEGKTLRVDRPYQSNNYKRIGNEDIIGNRVDSSASTEDIFWNTGVTFDPVELPLEAVYGSNNLECPKHKAILNNRNGKILHVTNKTYTPLNNDILLKTIEPNRNILDIEHVTSMNNGARCFISCAIKDGDQDVSQDDPIRRRLVFINSFDGSYSFKVVMIDFRLWCFNQMGRINKANNKLVFKHTKNILDYASHLPEIIAQQRDDLKISVEELKAMKKVDCNGSMLKELFKHSFADKLTGTTKDKITKEKRAKNIFDVEKEMNQVIDSFRTGNDHTLYGAFNALTFQQTHLERRTKDDTQAARVRFESLLSGKCGMRIDKAREKCLALTR